MNLRINRSELIEADFFAGINLNETGAAEDFIEKIKSEIKTFDTDHKNEFVLSVIRRIHNEKDWHNNLCALEECSVKQYFDKCLHLLQAI